MSLKKQAPKKGLSPPDWKWLSQATENLAEVMEAKPHVVQLVHIGKPIHLIGDTHKNWPFCDLSTHGRNNSVAKPEKLNSQAAHTGPSQDHH